MATANKFVSVAMGELGYLEKASNSQLDSKTANAGSGNYTKYGAWYGDNGAYWCQQFISWVAYMACGGNREAGKKLLCGGFSEYTPTGKSYFTSRGRYYKTPKVGDVVYFYHSSQGRVAHVGIVVSVNTASKTFETVEGNTSSTECSRNGGCVASHPYSYANVGGGNRVDGFGRPVFDQEASAPTSTGKSVGTGKKGMAVTASELNVRETPGGNVVGVLKNGNRIAICKKSGSGAAAWFGYKDGDSILWVSGRYLEGWVLEDGKWWYCNAGYVYKTNAWQKIDGLWYYFDENGWMLAKKWVKWNGIWYYMQESGAMATSMWLNHTDKKWYYLKSDGAMAVGVYVKSANSGTYYWLSAGNQNNGDDQPEGVWEPQWNTTNPNLSKYRVAK